jgi:hypothetical protein
VIELTAKVGDHTAATNPELNDARGKLDRWQVTKGAS